MGADTTLQLRYSSQGSAVDAIGHTLDVQKAALAVFFGMINPPH